MDLEEEQAEQQQQHQHQHQQQQEVNEEEVPSIHGDVLEAALSHVPLVDLASASLVSRPWRHAVSTSLRHSSKPPWLVVHVQDTVPPYSITTHAYDPLSHAWIRIRGLSVRHVSVLRSSNSTLLYMLSPSRFAFSVDPLRLTWRHADAAPAVWRTDPMVALVGGRHLVVAGGTSEYEDDPLAVEVYDVGARTWERCESMPVSLKHSASSTWLSVAVHDETGKVYVTEKRSGRSYAFGASTKAWHGAFDLCADEGGFWWVTGFAGGRLILVGLLGRAEDVRGVKMWEVSGESLEHRKEMGEMPGRLLAKLKGNSPCVWSICMSAMGDFVYLHNPWDPEQVIQCEIVDGGCRWDSVRNAAVDDTTRIMQSVVVSCTYVGMRDLQKAVAMGLEARRLTV